MGCLVAKCSLTNVSLREGDEVYINIIVDAYRERSWARNNVVEISGVDGVKVADIKRLSDSVDSRYNSFHYYKSTGIILKGTYEGWSSFEPSWDNPSTVKNFKMLADALQYSSTQNGRVLFNAVEFHMLLENNDHKAAWKLVDEALHIQSEESLYVKHEFGDFVGLKYNIISKDAYDELMYIDTQIKMFEDVGDYQSPIKTIAGFVNYIPNYLNEIATQDDDFDENGKLEFKYLKRRVASNLIENHRCMTRYNLISRRNGLDDCIVHNAITNCEDIQELTSILERMVTANYLNMAFVYYNVMLMPVSNVNFEEYCNDRITRFNKLQAQVIQSHQERFYEHDTLFGFTELTVRDNEDRYYAMIIQNENSVGDFHKKLEQNGIVDYSTIVSNCTDEDVIMYDGKRKVVTYTSLTRLQQDYQVKFNVDINYE